MKTTSFTFSSLYSVAAKVLLPLVAGAMMSACSNQGTSAPPPQNVAATAGDGRITLSWTGESGVDYWIFGAADATLASDNWYKLSGALSKMNATSPSVICGLGNTTPYYFALNGRRDGGPGGEFSTVVNATPRSAGEIWQTQAGIPNGSNIDWLGLTERGGQVCGSSTADTAVNYVAVGTQGKIGTSVTGNAWSLATSTPDGFAKTLHAVASNGGSTARWVAVGEEGVSLVSTDGATWTQGAIAVAGDANLRGVSSNGVSFIAVGERGTIKSSTDGVTWTPRTSGVAQDLSAISYSSRGYFIAVGDEGTVLISGDGGVNWAKIDLGSTASLKSVASGNFLTTDGALQYGVLVAGQGGAAYFSTDGGQTFANIYSQASFGTIHSADFVATGHYSRFALANATGQVWLSSNGTTWSGPFETLQSAPKVMVGADGRYLVAGSAGNIGLSF